MIEACGILAFLTDFGTSDPYVPSMKGVAMRVCRSITLVDITHEIPPFDVDYGSYILFSTYKYFPPGTVFVAVVDPGVGTSRKPIAIASKNYYFVGPDNGILMMAAEEDGLESAVVLTREELFWKPVSRSFHGRDIFAPVAARIACGYDFRLLGEPVSPSDLARPKLRIGLEKAGDCVKSWVIHVDRFGNVILSEKFKRIIELLGVGIGNKVRVVIGDHEFTAIVEKVFSVAPPGTLVLYENSFQLAELAVNLGSAERILHASKGDSLTLCK
ncbi:MAG: SAM-dependent chlorinase/fluorinase [Sulfolobales archaeon]